MNQLVEQNLQQIRNLMKSHKVAEAYIFGSAVTERFDRESDIDVLVSFDRVPFDGYAENFWDLEEKLQEVLGRKIDLVPQHTLKNPYFISEIEKSKVLIYG